MKIAQSRGLRNLFASFAVCLPLICPVVQAADSGDSSSASAAGPDFMASARAAIDGRDYRQAIEQLDKALEENPQNADALNLMGYSQRKSGLLDQALDYYRKALAIEPEHRGANEYLGELYLQRGELVKAEQRLSVLDGACFMPCDEFTDLKQAIADYRRRKGLN